MGRRTDLGLERRNIHYRTKLGFTFRRLNVNYSFVIDRPFWRIRIEKRWERAPIVWLSGVRRVGKTVLAESLEEATYINADLPSSVRRLEEPESFLRSVSTPILVVDEIHALDDPSRFLKIAADEYGHLKVLATGSSTLAATRKFRDSLSGRKRSLTLTPVLYRELEAFGVKDIERRLHRGGFPQVLLDREYDPGFFAEWLDSYFARDIQELFRIGKRREFLLMCELLLRRSGGLVQITNLAKESGLTRPTVLSYLQAMDTTHFVTVLRPFHGGAKRELVRQPKFYGFDTGIISYVRGWATLRQEDLGLLWEHLVLDELRAIDPTPRIHFWRDKSGREIDFVIPASRDSCTAIECKWNPDQFDASNLRHFRSVYPKGRNYVVSPMIEERYERSVDGNRVIFQRPDRLKL